MGWELRTEIGVGRYYSVVRCANEKSNQNTRTGSFSEKIKGLALRDLQPTMQALLSLFLFGRASSFKH